MINQTNIVNFYSFLTTNVKKYNPALPCWGIEEHDYWDHLLPPVPQEFEKLGFIPPTARGEIYAEIAASLRCAVKFFLEEDFDLYWVERVELSLGISLWDEWEEEWISDPFVHVLDACTGEGLLSLQIKFKAEVQDYPAFCSWVVDTAQFWMMYEGEMPYYVI